MEIDKFLNLDLLNSIEWSKQRDVLLRTWDIIEKKWLNRHFIPFQKSKLYNKWKHIDHLIETARQTIRENFAQNGKQFRIKHRSRRNLIRDKILWKQWKNIKQILSLWIHSWVLWSPDNALIYDICSWPWLLSSMIHSLREGTWTTTAKLIEKDSNKIKNHTLFLMLFWIDSTLSEVILNDLDNISLDMTWDSSAYLLAKHACWSASDIFIEKISQLKDLWNLKNWSVMTCCHWLAKNRIPLSLRNNIITDDDWITLSKTASWTDNNARFWPEVNQMWKVAMRIVDSLRILNVPDIYVPSITEIINPDITPNNHCISLEPAN